MAVQLYIIESWVMFHLQRKKVEFSGFTTEMMKMMKITHGMETLLNRCN